MRPRTFRAILSWTLWPLSVAAFVGSLVYFAKPDDPASVHATVARTLLVILLAQIGLEFVLPFRQEWRLRGDRDIWRDIAHTVLYGQLGGLVAQLLFLSGATRVLAAVRAPHLWPTHAPLIAQVLLVVVIGDGLEYWLHRWSHTLPALWRVHAIHHMPDRLHMLKAGRHHVLYFLLRGLIVWTPLLILGVPPQLVVWQFVAVGVVGNVAHANIDFRVPGFMHRLLITPQLHRIHHSADPVQGNSNFGVVLPIWDMLSGTYLDPDESRVRKIGIENDPVPRRFVAELMWPFAT